MCKTSLFPIIPYILDKFDFRHKYRGWIHEAILLENKSLLLQNNT